MFPQLFPGATPEHHWVLPKTNKQITGGADEMAHRAGTFALQVEELFQFLAHHGYPKYPKEQALSTVRYDPNPKIPRPVGVGWL